MRIKDGDVYKLKQLDRIESMLERNAINEIPSYNSISFMNYFIMLIAFLMLMIVSMYGAFGFEKAMSIFNIMPLVIRLMTLGFLLCFLIDLFNWLRYYKALKDLKERYFKIEVKNK